MIFHRKRNGGHVAGLQRAEDGRPRSCAEGDVTLGVTGPFSSISTAAAFTEGGVTSRIASGRRALLSRSLNGTSHSGIDEVHHNLRWGQC